MTEPYERPPLGSWPRTYALAVACAVVVMALLYWMTAAFNVPAQH